MKIKIRDKKTYTLESFSEEFKQELICEKYTVPMEGEHLRLRSLRYQVYFPGVRDESDRVVRGEGSSPHGAAESLCLVLNGIDVSIEGEGWVPPKVLEDLCIFSGDLEFEW